ncbi:MAG: SpvB/TcaC N-terminal domain-containing protein [Bacteroidota bacterium]
MMTTRACASLLVLILCIRPAEVQSQEAPIPQVDDEFLPTLELPTFSPDPAAMVELPTVPKPDQKGGANTEIPLLLTPGRQDMTPSLSISYQSNAANGWLGKGWDLSVPSINIDTRWGVPRYDTEFETETYLWRGQQLAPVAHRGPRRARTAELSFHLRQTDILSRITRHGDQPDNYWWEINFPDGSTEYYGGLPESGPLDEASLDGPGNAKVKWALTREVDVHGNRIDYHYTIQADPGRTGSSELGHALYLDYILYTGFEDRVGPYRIDFMRDRELGEPRRADVHMDNRLGVKMVEADLLSRIAHSYDGQPIRSWELEYVTGAFSQSLLESITVYDQEGAEFYDYRFDYHNDLIRDNGEIDAYGSVQSWDIGNDDVRGNGINPILGFSNDISALGGATSTSVQVGTAVTFGPLGSPATKDYTVGGTVGGGSSTSTGALAFIDINGDGRPDKLIRQDNGLLYRPNLGDGAFGDIRPINGISDFSRTESSEISFGFEANVAPVFAGYENTTERSKTTIYFGDFNGDYLVDVAVRGTVYFNHLDANGDPTFTTNSGDTPSPVVPGANPDPNLVTIDPQEQEDLIDQAPLHDVVRRWEVPYSGSISLDAPVRLHPYEGDEDAEAYTRDDGVRVSIQLDNLEIWLAEIPAGDHDYRLPPLENLNVAAGQHLHFRVQSIFDGNYDRVDWDPEIYYESADTTDLDANRLPINQFQASGDFLLSSCQSVDAPFNGELRIEVPFSKPRTTDTVFVSFFRDDLLPLQTPLPFFTLSFPPGLVVEDSLILIDPLVVDTNTTLTFRASARSNVDWGQVEMLPSFYYTSIEDGRPAFSDAGDPLYGYCPAPEFIMYTKPVRRPQVWQAPDSSMYSIRFGVGPGNGGNDITGNFRMSIKSPDSLLAQIPFEIDNGNDGFAITESFSAAEGDSIYFDFTGADEDLANWIADEVAVEVQPFGALPNEWSNVEFSVAHLPDMDELVFGNGYRGWGQYVYNGNRERADAPILEASLVLPEIEVDSSDLDDIDEIDPNDPNAFDDLEDLGGDPTTEIFVPMIADLKVGYWRAYDDKTRVGPNYQQSSRLGEDDILLIPDLGGSGSAPAIESIAKIEAVAGGLSAGPGSLGVSSATNEGRNLIDVMDMNGDEYPDLVSVDRIQYTTVYGGLSEQSLSHSMGLHEVYSEALGVTAGGTFVDSGPSNTGLSGGAGSTRRTRRGKATVKRSGSKARSANESAEGGASLSGSYTTDDDWAEHSFFDMNGDGLLDKVWRGGDVALNYGYRFGARENWGFAEVRRGVSEDFGAGLGINISNNSIGGGFSVSRTDNHSSSGLQDINGDGLTDYLSYNDETGLLSVRLNTGTGLGPTQSWATLDRHLDEGDATSESANAAFTICINIFFVRICVNPSGSTGRGVSRVLSQFNDVNGDGFLDQVNSSQDSDLRVRSSRIGRTNMLARVHGPLGSRYEIDYAHQPGSYGQPLDQWVMTELEVFNGEGGFGADFRRSEFSYQTPTHDRHEREFLGYARVTETQLDTENGDLPYRQMITEYLNDHIYHHGLTAATYILDSAGNKYREVKYNYEIRDPFTNAPFNTTSFLSDQAAAWPLLSERVERFYEGEAIPGLQQRFSFRYDSLGNITESISTGNGFDSDVLRHVYSYHPSPNGAYQTSTARQSQVFGGEELIRQSQTQINDRGQYEQVRHWIDDTEYITFDMSYDDFGNLTEVVRPPNHRDQRLSYRIDYDSVLTTYATTITDALGYRSSTEYEYLYGTITKYKGINGQTSSYEVDSRGRLKRARLPMDSLDSYIFEYHADTDIPWAKLDRYDPSLDRYLSYYTFCDGEAEIVQSKRPAAVGTEAEEVLIVSGARFADPFGRTEAEYYATTEPVANGPIFNATTDDQPPSLTVFDVLDRPVRLESPDGSVSQKLYDISADRNGLLAFRTVLIDRNGSRTSEFTDLRGHLQAHLSESESGDIWMSRTYNVLGELLEEKEHYGFTSEFEYDRLGRLIAERPYNAGTTRFKYDQAGNMIRRETPNLIALNEEEPLAIEYTYDYERLVLIDYPKNFQNRVEISYGEPDAPYNRAGRIWLRQDASGGQEFFFDEVGNTTKEIRTLLINEASSRTWVSEARYDSWGRLDTLIYPDGEQLVYSYLLGGQLNGFYGEKFGRRYDYLESSRYNEFGELLRRQYGNSTGESYSYESATKRLSNLQHTGLNGNNQDWQFRYDAQGNLLNVEQNIGSTTSGLGGTSTQSYLYDQLHQLIRAEGTWETTDGREQFLYSATYGQSHNLDRQEMVRLSEGDTLADQSRNWSYRYSDDFPHQLTEVGGRRFAYDHNGNQLSYTGENGSYRYEQNRWDEEDRLMSYSDNGRLYYFTYDASGRRVIESQGRQSGVFTDGAPSGFINHGENFRAHPSRYMTVDKDGFTKHYFADEDRIASRRGTGEFNNYYWFGRGFTAGDQNYTARIQALKQTVWNYYGEMGLPPGPPTLPGYYGQPEQTGVALPTPSAGEIYRQTPPGWPGPNQTNDPAGPPGVPTYYPDAPTRESLKAGYGYEGYGQFPEADIRFYHLGPLGQVDLTTDLTGEVSEIIAYAPNGEELIRQSQKTPLERYAYAGKPAINADQELYDFGARFYDSEFGIWLSRDPLAKEFPAYNPYAFVLHNPLRFTDPDGMAPYQKFNTEMEAAVDFARIYNKKSIRDNWEYGASLYKRTDRSGRTYYFYDKPTTDRKSNSVFIRPRRLRGATNTGNIHTHSQAKRGCPGYNHHSGADLSVTRHHNRRGPSTFMGYMVNPRGELKVYDPSTDDVDLVATGLPWDEGFYKRGDPNRRKYASRRKGVKYSNLVMPDYNGDMRGGMEMDADNLALALDLELLEQGGRDGRLRRQRNKRR